MEDFSALRYMRDAARAQGLNRTLSLIPALADPRNLYSVIQPQTGVQPAVSTSLSLPASPTDLSLQAA